MPRNPDPMQLRTALSADPTADPAAGLPDLGNLYTAIDPNTEETSCMTEFAEDGLVPAGGSFLVGGDGFTPNAEVSVSVDSSTADEPQDMVDVATFTADAGGVLFGEVPVPGDLVDGDLATVRAEGVTPQGRQVLIGLIAVSLGCDVPVGPSFTFEGFFAPVNNLPTVNTAKAGSAIPVKFGLGGDFGPDIFASGSPSSTPVDCASGAATDEVEQTATSGSSVLTYDAATGRYQYVWKSKTEWANTCRRLDVALADGTTKSAMFSFR
jgi:hypothetical protein